MWRYSKSCLKSIMHPQSITLKIWHLSYIHHFTSFRACQFNSDIISISRSSSQFYWLDYYQHNGLHILNDTYVSLFPCFLSSLLFLHKRTDFFLICFLLPFSCYSKSPWKWMNGQKQMQTKVVNDSKRHLKGD